MRKNVVDVKQGDRIKIGTHTRIVTKSQYLADNVHIRISSGRKHWTLHQFDKVEIVQE